MGINYICKDFECGASSEVYCTYDQTVIQLEYCAIILKLINPSIDFIFIFYNSCEQYKGIEDSLNVTNIEIGHVGSQKQIHPTKIKQEFDFFGPNERIVDVGHKHHMVFQDDVGGPYWMNPQEHLELNFSQYDDPLLKIMQTMGHLVI